MNMKKILSLLMAVAMVLSLVVVPAYATEERALKLADKDGNTTITAEAGSKVEVYLSTVGTWGFNAIGGYVTYPDGWTVKSSNQVNKLLVLEEIEAEATFTNYDGANPVSLLWTTMGVEEDDGTKLLEIGGTLAKLTFTIPAEATPGTYDITIDTVNGNPNVAFAHDANGVITSFDVADATILDVAAINCQIVIPAAPAAPADCPEHGESVWNDLTATGGALTSGHYKLAADVSLTGALTVAAGETVCIDLAGKNLTQTATATRVFEVAAGGTLTVIDSVGTGVISGGVHNTADAMGGNVYTEGTFNLYGGTISGGQAVASAKQEAPAKGGNIYGAAGSVINIKGGTVTGGVAKKAGSYTGASGWVAGGNIATLGTLNISDGTISGGNISHSYKNNYSNRPLRLYGGNIWLGASAAMTVSGGTISGGKISGTRTDESIVNGSPDSRKGSDAYGYGGNIYATGASVTISGGTITGGEIDIDMIVAAAQEDSTAHTYCGSNGEGLCLYGGNVYVTGGNLTMTGGVVTEGKLDGTVTAHESSTSTSATRANLFGANIAVFKAAVSITGGEISKGSILGSNTNATAGAQATTYASGADLYLNQNTSVVIGGDTEISGGSLNVTQTADTVVSYVRGGNVFMTKNDVTIEGNAVISGGTITHTYTASTADLDDGNKGGSIYVPADDVLTLQGNAVVADGVLNGDFSATRGGNIYVAGTLEMKGNATITGGTSAPEGTAARGGNVFVSGTFNMYGGTISDGYAGWGTNIMMMSGAKMNMYGGLITGGTGSSYSLLNQRGTLKVYGGEIQNTDGSYGALATDGTSDTNGGNTYIFDGVLGVTNTNRKSNMYVFGGTMEAFKPSATKDFGETVFYNVVIGSDPTGRVAACSEATGVYTFVVTHAEGTCETCAHTFGAECATCGVAHEANGCVHTFVEGVCSKCEFVAAAHTAECANGCENVTWTIWDGITTAPGHYYLADDLQLQTNVTIESGTFCLDLNGKTLTGPITLRAFIITGADTVVNIMDSSAANTGVIAGAGYAVEKNGGLLSLSAGTLNLYDATLTGGIANADRGGNIYIDDGLLVIDNAKVTNGKIDRVTGAARGANICNYSGTVIIKGADAKVTGGAGYSPSNTVYGGNYYAGTGGELYIYDGEISGGFAKSGANICIMNGTLEKGWNSNNYMYGGLVGDVMEGTAENAGSFVVYGGNDYANNFYMFGGKILGFKDNNGGNEKLIYNGILDKDPTTLAKNGSSLLASCAVVSFDEVTGLYTISHVNTAETCKACAANDAGAANGYSEAHIYTYVVEGVEATINGTAYAKLTEALTAAQATDVVNMVKDVAVDGDVDIYSGLELNGYTLTATGVIDASNKDASIADSVGTGVATGSEFYAHAKNGMLAVDAANDNNVTFETVAAKQKFEANGEKTRVKFIVDAAADATKLDEAILAGSDVKVQITVYSAALNDGFHTFVYQQSMVETYAAAWGTKMFYCDISGLEDLGEYTVVAEIVSEGVVLEAVTVA